MRSRSRIVPATVIERHIHVIRGHKVMIDRDLALLYRVTVKALNQAVRRNGERFPDDFMFQLTWEESAWFLRSQSVTLKRGQHAKYRPYVFTEQGVAMLSSVLRSKPAIQVNIAIMRTFVRVREILASHKELARKLDEMERKCDRRFKVVFDAIRSLMPSPGSARRQIGFRPAAAKPESLSTRAAGCYPAPAQRRT